VDTRHENSDNDWTYQLLPQSFDYSEPVTFSANFPDDNWNELVFRFSDNNSDFVEETITTSANDEQIQITNYKLRNSPNPFNPSTTISFEISNEQNEQIQIEIYNTKGQVVDTIPVILSGVEGSVIWNGDNKNGNSVSSGVYFYKLTADGKTLATKKMIMLK